MYQESIRQKRQPRPRFHPAFRLLWVLLSTVWSGWKSAAELMKPKTVLKWHEHVFLPMVVLEISTQRRPSNHQPGNASVDPTFESRERPVECRNNPRTFGATRVRSTLPRHHPRKYMVKPSGGTDKSQTWLTFVRNHLQVSWAMDFFTVPTVRFQILYLFVILNHSRRQVAHFAVTAHPTMAWMIQQLREAMPFGQQPTYLFRDNDAIYRDEVSRFLAGTGIAEVKTAHRCPWQNPFVEGYGGTYDESCWIT